MGLEKQGDVYFVFICLCLALFNLLYNKEILFCIIDKSNKKVEYKNKEYNFERKYIEISRLVSLDKYFDGLLSILKTVKNQMTYNFKIGNSNGKLIYCECGS